MGAVPPGGGSTTSFTNTPQAVDDCYSYAEDWLLNSSLYNSLTKRITLDVMANDLGGNAKSLFSVEDGDGNPLTADFDLLCKDVDPSGVSPWEQTNDGNWIRINSGKIEFMIGDGSCDITKARSLDSLAAGECVDDEFVYAIRLANGTLSEATVKIHIVGENDAVTLGAVTDATIQDTAADDVFADITGSLTSTDPDAGDAPTYGVAGGVASVEPGFDLEKATDYGIFYLNSETGAYKFVADAAAINALDSGDANVELDFAVSVSDGTTSDSDTLTITIDGANDAPELAAVSDATLTDTAADDTFSDITGSLVGSDRDDGETLEYGVDGGVASVEPGFDLEKATDYGIFYLNSETGAYKFVADAAAINALDSGDANVELDFAVSVSDGTTSDSDTLTITIDGANDAPELAAVSDATLTDTAADDTFSDITGSLVGSDRDDGETLEYGVDGGVASVEPGFDLEKATDYGIFYLNSETGAYKFVADAAAINALDSGDANVELDFAVSVSDGTTSDSDTLTITIDGANDAPELAAVSDATLTDTAADDTFSDITGSLVGSDRDDGETLEYGVDGGVASVEPGFDLEKATDYGIFYLNSETGAYKFVADAAAINALDSGDANVELDFAVSVSDGTTSDSDTLTITIDGANDAPELAAVSDATLTDTAADDTFSDITGSLVGSDRDDGETLEYGVDGGVASVEPGFDLEKATDYGIFYLNSETGAYKFVADAAAINALDSGDANVELDFAVSVSDGTTSDSDTLTITIDGANDAPELAAVSDATLTDTAADDTFSDITGSLVGSDRDDGETLEYGVDGGVASVEPGFDLEKATDYGIFYLNSETGAYKFVADAAAINALDSGDANVELDFAVSVSDGTTSDSDTLTITIDGANDAPELAAVSDATLTDTAADDTFSDITGSLVGSDRDDGETLEYGVDGGVASVEPGFDLEKATDYGIFYLNSETGAYKFVADAAAINALDSGDANVELDFAVSVSDGTTSDSDTLTITIDGANDAPAAAGTNSVTTNEDTVSAAIEIGATDLDGDTLTYGLLGGSEPANGTVDFDQVAGTFTYTPNEDYNGPDSFTILISDGYGGSVEQVVSVTVNSVNDAPAGTSASVTTLEDTAKTLATADFGFTDPKDDPDNALLSVKIASLPATGTLSYNGTAITAAQVAAGYSVSAADIASGLLVYTPPLNGTASASFTFQVQDDGGVSNGGVDLDQVANTLTIIVTAVNDNPSGADKTVTVDEDASFTFAVADFGFTDSADSPPNSLSAVKITTLPSAGTLKLNGVAVAVGQFVSAADIAAGLLVFTPAPDANGAAYASFTFQVQDDGGIANGGVNLDPTANTITVNVTPVDDGDPNDNDGSVTATTPVLMTQGTEGAQTLFGSTGNDVLMGGSGNDTMYGGAGDDMIHGYSGNTPPLSTEGPVTGNDGDLIYGGSGNDTIFGNQRDDTIYGGSGNDNLNGGVGQDQLWGGLGQDDFIFLAANESTIATNGRDTILDFSHSEGDRIDLTAFSPSNFVGVVASAGVVAANGVGYVDNGNGSLTIYVDTNGVVGADMAIDVVGVASLQASDFLL